MQKPTVIDEEECIKTPKSENTEIVEQKNL